MASVFSLWKDLNLIPIRVQDTHKDPIRMFFSEFSQSPEKGAQLRSCECDTVDSGLLRGYGSGDGIQKKDSRDAQLYGPAVFDQNTHGSLHKDPQGFSLGGLDLHQIADGTLLNKGKNLGQIHILHGVAAGHLGKLHSHIQRQLHQCHWQIHPDLITVGVIDDDPKHHFTDILPLLRGNKLYRGFRFLSAKQIVYGGVQKLCKLRKQADIRTGLIIFLFADSLRAHIKSPCKLLLLQALLTPKLSDSFSQ